MFPSENNEFRHHNEGLSKQNRAQRKTVALIEEFHKLGNPFQEIHKDFVKLGTLECTDHEVIPLKKMFYTQITGAFIVQ